MGRIGFLKDAKQSTHQLSECLSVWPEPGADLTLQSRIDLLDRGLGLPVPKIVRASDRDCVADQLILRHTYSPFALARRHEALTFYPDGPLTFTRDLEHEGSVKPAWDGDEFVERLLREAVRGVNILSLVSTTKLVGISIVVAGLAGSRLIFNPRRFRFNTLCEAEGPISRTELVTLAPRSELLSSLRTGLLNVSNALLNTFRLGRGVEYIAEHEFHELFDGQLRRLKFAEGAMAELGETALIQTGRDRAGPRSMGVAGAGIEDLLA